MDKAPTEEQSSSPDVSDNEKGRPAAPRSSDKEGFLNRQLIHLLLIGILGFLAYSNTFHGPFQWDETEFIVGNAVIRDLGYFTDISRAEGMPVYDGLKSRYIGYLTFALNYKLHGFNVLGYHLVNLAIHLVNAILVYFLVLLTFRTPYFDRQLSAISNNPPSSPLHSRGEQGGVAQFTTHHSRFTIHDSRFFALAVALLFVAHPIQTEAVTYVFQRMASLVSLFFLLSLVLYVKGRLSARQSAVSGQQSVKASRFTILWYLLSLLSAVFAMKTKENAFTLPVVITLYEFLFFSGQLKGRVLRLAPFLLTMLIVPLTIMGTGSTPGEIISQVKDPASLGYITPEPADYFFTQFRVIVTYLRLLVMPVGQNIAYHYPLYHSFFALPVMLSFLFLSSLFGAAVYLVYKSRRRAMGNGQEVVSPIVSQRLIAFGILWFFITLSVESSIIPIPMLINEYRVYLPSVGFFLAVMTGIALFLQGFPGGSAYKLKVAAALFVVIVLGLASATYARNVLWKDKVSLWEDVVRKSPDAPIGHNNIGTAYGEKGLFDKALAGFNRAIALYPSYHTAYNNRGIALSKVGRFDEAIADYDKAIALKPGYSEAYNNRGSAFEKTGQLDRAIADYDRAIALKPRYSEAYAHKGIAYGKAGLFDASIESLNKSLEIDPNNVDAYVSRGISYSRVGQNDRALEDYTKAIRLDQKHILAYFNRGDLHLRTGNKELAMLDFQKACHLGDKEGCNALQAL